MACDCIATTDTLLVGLNTKIAGTIVIPRDGSPGYVTVTLEVEKIAPRGRRPVVVAPTYCPFCGVPYVPLPVAAAPTPEPVAAGAPGEAGGEAPSVADGVRRVVREVLAVEPERVVDAAYLVLDLGADSLDFAMIEFELETAFPITCGLRAIEDSVRVGDLVALVERRLAARPVAPAEAA